MATYIFGVNNAASLNPCFITQRKDVIAELIIGILVLILVFIVDVYLEGILGDKLKWVLPTILGIMIFKNFLSGENETEKYLAVSIIFIFQIFWIFYLQKKEQKKKS